jgi:hypothetical protein
MARGTSVMSTDEPEDRGDPPGPDTETPAGGQPPRPTDVIHDPRFRDAAELGTEEEPFARPPWDSRPYPDAPGQ